MTMTPEGKVKNQVKKILDAHKVYHFSPPGMGLGRAGIPDIIACFNGRFIGIECKAGKGQPTPLQSRELGRIDLAGGKTFVIRETNMNDIVEFIWANN